MKKQFMFMAMAAMLIASCSSDDVVSTNTGRAIDFRTSVGTRGTETTTANITKFWVTAIDEAGDNYFSKQEFTKVGEFFTSSPLYYWPADTLNFFAYSPSEKILVQQLLSPMPLRPLQTSRLLQISQIRRTS